MSEWTNFWKWKQHGVNFVSQRVKPRLKEWQNLNTITKLEDVIPKNSGKLHEDRNKNVNVHLKIHLDTSSQTRINDDE